VEQPRKNSYDQSIELLDENEEELDENVETGHNSDLKHISDDGQTESLMKEGIHLVTTTSSVLEERNADAQLDNEDVEKDEERHRSMDVVDDDGDDESLLSEFRRNNADVSPRPLSSDSTASLLPQSTASHNITGTLGLGRLSPSTGSETETTLTSESFVTSADLQPDSALTDSPDDVAQLERESLAPAVDRNEEETGEKRRRWSPRPCRRGITASAAGDDDVTYVGDVTGDKQACCAHQRRATRAAVAKFLVPFKRNAAEVTRADE